MNFYPSHYYMQYCNPTQNANKKLIKLNTKMKGVVFKTPDLLKTNESICIKKKKSHAL